MNLLKKYVVYYQIGGSGEATKAKAKAKATKGSGSGSGGSKATKGSGSGSGGSKATKGKAKAKATKGSGSGSGNKATKGKAKATKESGSKATKGSEKEEEEEEGGRSNAEEVVEIEAPKESNPNLVKLVGPHMCHIFKIADKTIILFGESHAKIPQDTEGLFYHKYLLYLLDKLKKHKCLDIYHEYEYPIAKHQEKNRSSPKSISNSCGIDYTADQQYIVWIDDFYKECIVNKKRVRLHSFDLRKIFDVGEGHNYILYNLFYAYVVDDINYKDTFKILGHEEFDETNQAFGIEGLPGYTKTINGKYFDNKSTIDPLRIRFTEELNSAIFNKNFIFNIIENLLGFKDDNKLLSAMFELLDKSHELNLINQSFDASKHAEAIEIINKQFQKTTFTNKDIFTTFLTESFIVYFENFPEENYIRSNLIEKSNQSQQSQQQSFLKIKMITLIYLHLLTDVYGFLRMVLSWSKEEPKLSRKSGCIGDNYEQKNIVFYGGGNHTYLLSIFLGKYYKMEPKIYKNVGKNYINDFPLDII
jgi:hypothetical protein